MDQSKSTMSDAHHQEPRSESTMGDDDDQSTIAPSEGSQGDNESVKTNGHSSKYNENSEDESLGDPAGDPRPTRLRNRERLNYAQLHRFGETQLLQRHKLLCCKIIKQSEAKEKDKSLKRALIIKTKETFHKVMGIVIAHMPKVEYDDVSMKQGLERFGERAVEAVLKEFAQLDDSDSFEPQYAHPLTRDQKHSALNLITLVKKKRCGKIKGRACTDGRKTKTIHQQGRCGCTYLAVGKFTTTLMIDPNEKKD